MHLWKRFSRLLRYMQAFIEFIQSQGVVGLAVAFILGAAITKVVTSLVDDIINPIVGVALGKAKSLEEATLTIGSVKLKWGSFLNRVIDFVIVAAVVYGIVSLIGVELKK